MYAATSPLRVIYVPCVGICMEVLGGLGHLLEPIHTDSRAQPALWIRLSQFILSCGVMSGTISS